MNVNEGGPAFPNDRYGDQGMTLRDYFAAQALAAGLTHAQEDGCILPAETAAADAYKFADAMLAERAK